MANIYTQVAVVGKDRSRRANSPRGDRFYQLKISSSDADPKARKISPDATPNEPDEKGKLGGSSVSQRFARRFSIIFRKIVE